MKREGSEGQFRTTHVDIYDLLFQLVMNSQNVY